MCLGGDRSDRQHATLADRLRGLRSCSCHIGRRRTTRRQQAGKSSGGKGEVAGDEQNASPSA